jgi:hypothetical protein
MRDKRRVRWVEWTKNVLIVLLTLSAIYLLGRTQLSSGALDKLRQTLHTSGTSADHTSAQTVSAGVEPVRLAVCQDGQRYGVQYAQQETDEAFAALSTLLSEALVSADTPRSVSEQTWRSALSGTGIYLDFLYPVSLQTLAAQLGAAQNAALTDTVRRLCLADDGAGGVCLFYIKEEDGSFWACDTTLTTALHLEGAVEGQSPNGALFAFEMDGMEELEPYTLVTGTTQPTVYGAANPLLEDSSRTAQLLSALSFRSQSADLDPSTGGQLMEGNDSLRLSSDGLVTFHTIGDSGFRFTLKANTLQGAVEYTRSLAQATAGAWCGEAWLCLSQAEQTTDGYEITFQYCLNGAEVALPGDYEAAHFVVKDGAVTDFTLYLRAYTDTGETSLVLPEELAAAALTPLGAEGRELVLLYQDHGTDRVTADWIAK